MAIIHLGLPLPTASCDLPANIERAARSHRPCGPLGLAPGGVYRAAMVTHGAGGLLHHRFTLARITPGGLFSVALSRGLPRVGVTHRLALWSPDFPRHLRAAITRPTRPLRRLRAHLPRVHSRMRSLVSSARIRRARQAPSEGRSHQERLRAQALPGVRSTDGVAQGLGA